VKSYWKGAFTLLLLSLFPLSHCVCSGGSVGSTSNASGTGGEDRPPAFSITLDGAEVGILAHPRIFMSPAKIEALRARAVSSNAMWVGLDSANSISLGNGDYKKIDAYRPLWSSLVNFTLGYLTTGSADDLAAVRTTIDLYLTKFDLSCPGTNCYGNDNIDYGSEHLAYLAACYDWLAGTLSDTEKTAIRNWVFDQLIPFLRHHPYYGDPEHNLGHTKWIGEFLWALSTIGEDSRADTLLADQYAFWKYKISPIFDQFYPGGHTYSGSGYGYNRSFKFALYGMEALKTATTIDGYEGHPWAKDLIGYRIHSVLPSQDLFHSDWESSEATFNQGRQTENEALVVARFQGMTEAKTGQHFINEVFRPRAFYNQGGNRVHPYYVGLWFLWYDPNFEALSYFDGPSAYVASGLGLGFSRTSWTDANSAWAAFSASSYVGDHQLHNEGSFKIWKNGKYLVMENGPCYAANSGFYAGEASGTPTDANIFYLGTGSTGGLPTRGTKSTAGIPNFSQGSTYSYFGADLSSAYGVAMMNRIFGHFHAVSTSPNDYFVVVDRIRSSTTARKTYIYVPSVPVASGSDFVVTAGSGRLQVRNLLPGSLTVETPTDHTNSCVTQGGTDSPRRLVSSGSADLFLSVLQAGGSSSSMPASDSIVPDSGSAFQGVLIKDSALNRALIVSADGSTLSGTIRFTVSPTATTEYVIGDLPANQGYEPNAPGATVILTPTTGGSLTSDASGVLRFLR
jgi:hypothetical protein